MSIVWRSNVDAHGARGENLFGTSNAHCSSSVISWEILVLSRAEMLNFASSMIFNPSERMELTLVTPMRIWLWKRPGVSSELDVD